MMNGRHRKMVSLLRRSPDIDGRRGFSLIEIVLSLVILALTMIPIAAIMGYGFKGTQRDQRQIKAIQLCQARLNQAMRVPFLRLNSTTTTITSGTVELLKLGTETIDQVPYDVALVAQDRAVAFSYQPVDVNRADYSPTDPANWQFLPATSWGAPNMAKQVTIVVSWTEKSLAQAVRLSTFVSNLEQ